MMTDPIADMTTRVKNAYRAGKNSCRVPYSKIKWDIAEILRKENCIAQAQASGDKRDIELTLRYPNGKPAVTEIIRVSRPGRRIYETSRDLPNMKNNFGFAIVSTPSGVMTSFEARRKKIGGEVLCKVLRV